MAKVNAPLLSFSASGSIANTQTYSKWRGVPYVRQKVTPANPNSPDQQLTRNTFKWLVGIWKLADARFQAPWDAFAAGQPFVGRNALISKNNSALRTETDLTAMVFSPGAKGGLAAVSATPTPGAGTISIAVVAPELPTGWTIIEAVATVIKAANPQDSVAYNSVTSFDATTPFAPAFTGLAAGSYEYGAWFKFQKPNGQFAYGPSLTGTTTVT